MKETPLPHSCMITPKEGLYAIPKRTESEFRGKKALLLGYSVRSINMAAKELGMETYAVDYFTDMDLRVYADKFVRVEVPTEKSDSTSYPLAYYLCRKALEILTHYHPDYIITTSAVENHPELIADFEIYPSYTGCTSDSLRKVRDPEVIFPYLKKYGLRYPKTVYIRSISVKEIKVFDPSAPEITKSVKVENGEITRPIQLKLIKVLLGRRYDTDDRYYIELLNLFNPISDVLGSDFMVKGVYSGGGVGVNRVENNVTFAMYANYTFRYRRCGVLAQQYIDGVPMSLSAISDGNDAVPIGFTVQLIGEKRLGCRYDFTYCGNVLLPELTDPGHPFLKEMKDNMTKMLKTVVEASGVKGSIGIDFILPYGGDCVPVRGGDREHKPTENSEDADDRRNIGKSHRIYFYKFGILPPYLSAIERLLKKYREGKPISTSDPVFMEVNPRFQGSLDAFSAFIDLNLCAAHIRAIHKGQLPDSIIYRKDGCVIRAIYYAPKEFRIMTDLRSLGFMDVPVVGELQREYSAMCSALEIGRNLRETFIKVLKNREILVKVTQLKYLINNKSPFLRYEFRDR